MTIPNELIKTDFVVLFSLAGPVHTALLDSYISGAKEPPVTAWDTCILLFTDYKYQLWQNSIAMGKGSPGRLQVPKDIVSKEKDGHYLYLRRWLCDGGFPTRN